MQPVGFCVLVKPDPPKEKFGDGSIAIPDMILDKFRVEITTGTLLSIGNMAWKGIVDGTHWAKVGDHVVYAKYGGKQIEDPETGEKLVLLLDKDIIGVL